MTSPFVASYAALTAAVASIGDGDAWRPTGCLGWSVRDLVFHLHGDALRGLVSLHTPADRAPDTDAVSYWRSWGADPERDEQNRRFTRIEAGLYGWPGLRDRHVEAALATSSALVDTDPALVVSTQGHALTAADLASTLAVEATLHHLDLAVVLSAPGPSAAGLAEVRRVVEALLDRRLTGWSDERAALVGTGRAEPSAAELGDLDGAVVPVFT